MLVVLEVPNETCVVAVRSRVELAVATLAANRIYCARVSEVVANAADVSSEIWVFAVSASEVLDTLELVSSEIVVGAVSARLVEEVPALVASGTVV